MSIRSWVRLPSIWIEEGGLKQLSWGAAGQGADNIAALMALTAIAHVADDETGIARVTYDQLCGWTGLSRAKLSSGLQILKTLGVIARVPDAPQSTYRLMSYDPQGGWAKLPGKRMYSGGRIHAFDEFRLRKQVELDALKLFFLFVARRDRRTNLANISYDKIEEYTGIKRRKIKAAISFLASLSLVYVEHLPSTANEQGISNAYRIVGVESRIHMGTRGRGLDEAEFAEPPFGRKVGISEM